jgi:hypothetical protein
MKKSILIVFLVSFFYGNLWSQTNPVSQKKVEVSRTVSTLEKNKSSEFNNQVNQARQFSPNGIVRCLSFEHNQDLQQRGLAPTDAQFEAWLAPKIEELKARRANQNFRAGVITIPVVVHVIHNGDAYGTGENIRDEQVLSQIQVMNEDFRRISGSPGFGPGVDVEIEFCLAQTDPNGNPTNGINRVNLTSAGWARTGIEGTVKPSTQWNPNDYLNMWTVRFAAPDDNLLGYAQFPSNSTLAGLNANGGAANTDGVVMAFSAFGSSDIYPAGIYSAPYDKGRTTTHEVGHWLGLRHIWGDGGCTVDDFCADTPTAGAPNYNCVTVNSCNDGPGDLPDQIQNYMDYTNDTCMDRFTQNQKDRMLTVMSVSPRRASLVSSTKCMPPAPFIQFGNTTGSIIEGTNCNYVDVNYPVTIARAATAAADVTFSVTGGTATQNIDYQIVTPSVNFPAGSTTAQNLVVRFFNDGIVEPNETIIIDLVLNPNGGNAVLNSAAKTITLTIENNDFAPTPNQIVNLITEDFEDITGWTVIDADGDARNWGLLNGADGIGTVPNTIVGRCAFSAKRLSFIGGSGNASPDNYLISPQITIPATAIGANLSYLMAGFGDIAGNYTVYFTTNASTAANITAGTVLQASSTIAADASILRTHNLSAFIGQTGFIVFRHTNNNGATGLLMLDNFLVTATLETPVQTEVNLATAYNASLKSNGTMYATDSATGRIMSGIVANSGFDYGCTSVYVDRSNTSVGSPTSPLTDALAANAVMSKTFRVSSQNDNPTGNYTISFYYTQAEVTAWEAATGKSRNDLYVIKVVNNPISAVNALNFGTYTIESQPVTMSSFGTNVVFQATFSSPLSGGYALGPQTTIVNCGDVTSTWNGTTWSNGTPYNKIVAVINGDYNTATNGSFSCCSLVVNAGRVVNIGANTNITVTGDITVNGTLNVLNNGSLVQVDDSAVNTGNISYERIVSIRKNDYVYWSSPISNFNVNVISPLTPSNYIFKWNPTVANTNGGFGNWVSAAGEIMTAGKGYIVKGPESFINTAQNFTATFVNGVPNNGIITTPISRGNYIGVNYNGTNGAQITRFDDNWNLIGNPYPSAIRALDFLNLNTNIEGAVRLWTHTSLPSSAVTSPFYGTTQSNYTPADYITYNGLGTVSGPLGFNGYIAGGQGFFVQMNDGAAATQNITFNNSLRSASYANNQFYRNAQGDENPSLATSRIWLDIVDSNNNSDRTLVGYTEGATAGKDRLFDAVTAAGLSMKIYSLIGEDLMTIQGKSYPIDVNDRVALGVNITASGNYSIAIAALDGIASDLPIYLEDKTLNIIHDLRQNPYSFSSPLGQFNDRFVLRYNNETLGNNDFVANNEVMVISNNAIQVVTTTTSIANVKIYSVLGQLLLDSNTVNATTFETSKIQKNNTALLVQVTLDNGVKVIKKIVF